MSSSVGGPICQIQGPHLALSWPELRYMVALEDAVTDEAAAPADTKWRIGKFLEALGIADTVAASFLPSVGADEMVDELEFVRSLARSNKDTTSGEAAVQELAQTPHRSFVVKGRHADAQSMMNT